MIVEDFKLNGRWIKHKGTDPFKVRTRAAETWYGMKKRVSNVKTRPSYKGCTVSKDFLDFQFFAEWCNDQEGYGNDTWELDKDLLIKGNKVYAPSTCVFVPQEINNALTKSNKSRGNSPIGVSYKKTNRKYVAQVGIGGCIRHLGMFDDEGSAFEAYKLAKEVYLKELAEKYKNVLDRRAYEALLKYSVAVND